MHLHHSDVKFEWFIELVTDETKVSSADVKAVFDCSTKVLIHLLQDGKGGDCGEMEAFRPSITIKTGRVRGEPEKVGVDLVDKANVIYMPCGKVKTELKFMRLVGELSTSSASPVSLRRRKRPSPKAARHPPVGTASVSWVSKPTLSAK